MQVFQRLYPVLITILCVTGCAGKLPLIGLDKSGGIVSTFVNEEIYSRRLSKALDSVQESVVPALSRIEEGEKKWKLRTAIIGIGLKAEAGIGPFKVGVKPRIRACFTNGDNAPIP